MRWWLLVAMVACGKGDGDTLPAGTGTPTGATGSDTDPAGDDDDDDDATPPDTVFVGHLIDDAATGARHAVFADLDGDAYPEIVASLNGLEDVDGLKPGAVVVYESGGQIASWSRSDMVPESSGMYQPNEPLPHDVDGDGDLDVIVPYGNRLCDPLPTLEACGGVAWMENAGGGWTRHDVLDGSATIFTSVALSDIDQDGILDLVTCGEDLELDGANSVTMWFKGTGDSAGFRPTPNQVGFGGGPWPTVLDLDGDGDEDIVVGERTGSATFVWFEQVAPPGGGNPAGGWSKHTLDDQHGPGWMIQFVDDLFGDGRTVAVGTNHTNTEDQNDPDPWPSAAFVFEPAGDVRSPWTATEISEGIAAIPDLALFPMEAPGIFSAGDIDGDGDLDLVLAGDGDPAVYLLQQTDPGSFTTRVLRYGIPRNGGVDLADVDQDGDLDVVVTGLVDSDLYVVEVQ